MPHQACRSLCWSGCQHWPLCLPLIEQWVGKLEMGLTMGLSFQVPRGELGCSQLPLTCLWQFAEKGEEILGLRCLDACPISPLANPPKLLHHHTCCRARESSGLCWWRTSPCLYQGQPMACRTTVAAAHSPSQLIKVSFPRLRFHH